MANKTSDYIQLKNLRDALSSLRAKEDFCKKAREHLEQLEAWLADVPNSSCGVYTDYTAHQNEARSSIISRIKAERQPHIQQLQNELDAHRKNAKESAANTSKTIHTLMWIVAVVLSLAALIFVLINKFGYSFFLTHQWNGIFVKSEDFIHGFDMIVLYIMGGCIVLGLAAFIYYKIDDNDIFFTVSMILWCIALLLMFIIAIIMTASTVSGWWWIIGWLLIPVFLLLELLLIARFLYAGLIITVLSAAIAIPIVAAVLVTNNIDLERFFENRPSIINKERMLRNKISALEHIDPALITNTTEFQNACRLDEQERPKREKQHQERVALARVEYTKRYQQLIIEQKAIIKEADQNLKKCKSIIANTSIHPSYQHVNTLNTLLYYFEYNLASTITEAVNLMRNDARYAQMQKEMRAQGAELRRQSQMLIYIEQENRRRHEEIKSELESINRGQDRIIETANAISRDCSRIASDMRYISDHI